MTDTTQVAHICEAVKEYLERLLIGFERKGKDDIQ